MNEPRIAVWLNHAEAHVGQVEEEPLRKSLIRLPEHPRLHRREGSVSGARAACERGFLDAVTAALQGAALIVIAGPGLAKRELFEHLQRHAPGLAARVVELQTCARVADQTLARHARARFTRHQARARLGL